MMAYRSLFLNADGQLSQDGEIVMADLIRFCKVKTSTTEHGAEWIKALEGRRQVFNRIWGFLNLSVTDVYRHSNDVDQDDVDGKPGSTNPLDAP